MIEIYVGLKFLKLFFFPNAPRNCESENVIHYFLVVMLTSSLNLYRRPSCIMRREWRDGYRCRK